MEQRLSLTRKLIHLAMALVPAAGWWFGDWLASVLAAAMLAASLIVEVARRRWLWVNRLLWRLLPMVFRAWEGRRVLGSTWFATGTLATLLLCGQDAGGTAVLFLACGDPAAEIAGRRWGRAGARKTLAGSLGCLAACLLAGVVGIELGGLSTWTVLAGAVVATLTERRSPPPDDNLWMPLFSGLVMVGVEWWLGGKVELFSLWR